MCIQCALGVWFFLKKYESTSFSLWLSYFSPSSRENLNWIRRSSIHRDQEKRARKRGKKKKGDQGGNFGWKSQVEKPLEFLHLLNEQVGQANLWSSVPAQLYRIWGSRAKHRSHPAFLKWDEYTLNYSKLKWLLSSGNTGTHLKGFSRTFTLSQTILLTRTLSPREVNGSTQDHTTDGSVAEPAQGSGPQIHMQLPSHLGLYRSLHFLLSSFSCHLFSTELISL